MVQLYAHKARAMFTIHVVPLLSSHPHARHTSQGRSTPKRCVRARSVPHAPRTRTAPRVGSARVRLSRRASPVARISYTAADGPVCCCCYHFELEHAAWQFKKCRGTMHGARPGRRRRPGAARGRLTTIATRTHHPCARTRWPR